LSQKDLVTENGGDGGGAKIASAGPWLLGVGGVAAVTALATLIVSRDDARGEMSLRVLAPIVDRFGEVGLLLLADPLLWITWICGVVATLAVVCGVFLWWRRRTDVSPYFPPVLVALGLALVGQIFLLRWWVTIGVIFYAGAVIVLVVAHLIGRRDGSGSIPDRAAGPPPYWEAATLLGIGVVAVFFRYYALNRVVFYLKASSLPSWPEPPVSRGCCWPTSVGRGRGRRSDSSTTFRSG